MNKTILGMLGIALAIAALLLYLSKPDRGGFQQCESLSGVLRLTDFAPKREILWCWKPFESPRFRFYMPRSNFDSFKAQTGKMGFQNWVIGDGQFGSFNEFNAEGNELYYTEKESVGKLCLFYYRPKTETLDVIIFYH